MKEPRPEAAHPIGYLMLIGALCMSVAFFLVTLKGIFHTPFSTPIKLVEAPWRVADGTGYP